MFGLASSRHTRAVARISSRKAPRCSSSAVRTQLFPASVCAVHKPDAPTHSKKSFFSSRAAGRIQVYQEGGKIGRKNNSKPRLCSGCGVEVVSGGASSGKFVTGQEAVGDKSKRAAKKARYVDVFDESFESSGGFLCQRCKALKSNDIWKAYDALHDVSPSVFRDQVSKVISRRRFGFCIAVVDSTDPEHSAMKKLRQTIGKLPCWLVFNKVDLVPRLNRRDVRTLLAKIKASTGTNFVKTFVVSAATNAGIVDLAEEILRGLQGKDVFVVGAANVGKSTLVKRLAAVISDAVYMKGRKGKKRRDATGSISVTGSNLPGTTLQAVRVPCFSSDRHAMWDTPGIINRKALQYSLFPSHLMEPLTRPEPIPIPTRDNGLIMDLRSGFSILIEAAWMDGQDGDEDDDRDEADQETAENQSTVAPCVLGRIDVLDVEIGRSIHVQCYVHPSLRVRRVPTSQAPDTATIPPEHVRRVHRRIQRATKGAPIKKEDYSIPLRPFKNPPRMLNGEVEPGVAEYDANRDRYFMDLSFASLGWISFAHQSKYTLIPHCVEGSVFSKRSSLYPLNMEEWCNEHYTPEHEPDVVDDEVNRRLYLASKEGRHSKKRDEYDDMYDDEEWY